MIAGTTVLLQLAVDELFLESTYFVSEFQVVSSQTLNRFFVLFGEGDDALVNNLTTDRADSGRLHVHDHWDVA